MGRVPADPPPVELLRSIPGLYEQECRMLEDSARHQRAQFSLWLPVLIALAVLAACAARDVFGSDDLDAWLKRQSQPACVYVFTNRSCSVCPRQQAIMDWLTAKGWVNARYGSGTLAHFVVVDTDAFQDEARRYGVGALPCLVAVRGDVVVARHEGLLGPDELRALWWKAKGK